MTAPDTDITTAAAEHRRRLADTLTTEGSLRDPAWRAAVEAVPRHEFAPRFYVPSLEPGVTRWVPITRERVGVDEWLTLAYSDQTLVTQFDETEPDWSDPQPVQGARPTSSSTLPSLVVSMLEALDVTDEANVLELGTGTGYSTALLCHRLGAGRITSVETDQHLALSARDALALSDYRPRLLCQDGLTGHREAAPYDRVIATHGVRTIPAAWVEQTRPGGLILTTVSGWTRSLGLVRLTVHGPDKAEGHFLTGDPHFMLARQQAAPESMGMIPAEDEGTTRETAYGPDLFSKPGSAFIAQLAMPSARHFMMPGPGDRMATYVLDHPTDSYAVLTETADGTWTVRQGGPVNLWDDVEQGLAHWHNASTPEPTEFGLTVTGTGQRVWLGSPDGPSWKLPEETL